MKLGVLNTSIMTTDGVYSLKTISLEKAQQLVRENEIESAIGHQVTADILTELLEKEIPMNRIFFQQEPGQKALVFKINGRPPEGRVLTREGIKKMGYTLKLMVRHS